MPSLENGISIGENGVFKLLSNLNSRKAAGPDDIPCRLLNEVARELAPESTLLFSRSLVTVQISAIWSHPDITFAVDWALKTSYLSISVSVIWGRPDVTFVVDWTLRNNHL